MSTPDGPPDAPTPDEPVARPAPPPPYGGSATPPQYGQPGPTGQPGPSGQPGHSGPYGPPGAHAAPPQPGQAPPQYGWYAPGSAPPPAPPVNLSGQLSADLKVGDALAFGWTKFTRNWAAWVLFAIIASVIVGALNAPLIGDYGSWFDRVTDHVRDGGDLATLPMPSITVAAQILSVVGAVAGLLVQVAAWHAALREADGARPSLGDFITVHRMGMALLALIVVNVVAGVVAIIPFAALAWTIFTVFVAAVVLDHGSSAFAAIGAGVRLVARNFGPVLLLLLTLLGINIAGTLLLGFGLLVSLPVSILALAYAFRRLTGGAIV